MFIGTLKSSIIHKSVHWVIKATFWHFHPRYVIVGNIVSRSLLFYTDRCAVTNIIWNEFSAGRSILLRYTPAMSILRWINMRS